MFVIRDFEQPLAPALPNASSSLLEAISGTPLCKQEFALREATAGTGLQVRVSRTPEWNVLRNFMYYCIEI